MFPPIGRLFVGGFFAFLFLLFGKIINDDAADDIDGQPGGGIDIFDGNMAVLEAVRWAMRASGVSGAPQVMVTIRAPKDAAFSAAVSSSGVFPDRLKIMTSS